MTHTAAAAAAVAVAAAADVGEAQGTAAADRLVFLLWK